MDFSQFIIAALRMGGRVEIHGPGSSEEVEHEQEEAEHGEGDESEGAGEAAEGSEEAEVEGGNERRTGYNRAARSPAAPAPDDARASVREQLMKAVG